MQPRHGGQANSGNTVLGWSDKERCWPFLFFRAFDLHVSLNVPFTPCLAAWLTLPGVSARGN